MTTSQMQSVMGLVWLWAMYDGRVIPFCDGCPAECILVKIRFDTLILVEIDYQFLKRVRDEL